MVLHGAAPDWPSESCPREGGSQAARHRLAASPAQAEAPAPYLSGPCRHGADGYLVDDRSYSCEIIGALPATGQQPDQPCGGFRRHQMIGVQGQIGNLGIKRFAKDGHFPQHLFPVRLLQ